MVCLNDWVLKLLVIFFYQPQLRPPEPSTLSEASFPPLKLSCLTFEEIEEKSQIIPSD